MANTSTSLSPLGELFEIHYEDHTAQIREIGASLFSYTVAGHAVATGPSVSGELVDVYKGSRGAVLIPWPGRVANGKYSIAGATLQLPVATASDEGHAMHGFIRAQRWSIDDQTESSIRLTTTMYAQVGYPFVLQAEITYALSGDGLAVTMKVSNPGQQQLPLVIGVHPYFSVGSSSADADHLSVPADSYLPLDDAQIPTGDHASVKDGDKDFREARSLKDVVLDLTYTDLNRDDGGVAHVILRSTETNRSLDVWMDETFGFVQLFTADTLTIPSDRRKVVAIEPMTGAPNAFNSGDGLIWLDANESVEGTWGARPF